MVELSWLTILLLVPLLYVVLAVFDTQRRAFGVSAAARAAGCAYATALSEGEGLARARRAATVALADQHLDFDRADLRITCRPQPDNCLAPGAVIDIDLSYPVPLPLMPAALGGDTPSFRVSTSHSLRHLPRGPMSFGGLNHRKRDERGQTSLLIMGFFVILLLLVGVVVDASAAYLRRQGSTRSPTAQRWRRPTASRPSRCTTEDSMGTARWTPESRAGTPSSTSTRPAPTADIRASGSLSLWTVTR